MTTTFAVQTLEELLNCYQIGALRKLTPVHSGYVNETAFVETTTGTYVVRRCHARLGVAAAQYRHRLMGYLAECRLPVPILIPDRAGRTFHVIGGRVWEIQSFIPGDDYDAGDPEQIAGIGALLARYHGAVAYFDAPDRSGAPRYTPRSIRSITEQLIERDVMADLSETLAWYDARAAHLGLQLDDTLFAALPHLVIHGDVHADNFRFRQHAAVGILDFDQVGWDARIVDLADALVAFAGVERRKGVWTWGVFAGPLDIERTALLLNGYRSAAALTPDEQLALPLIVEILWLRGALGRVLATAEGAPEYHRSVLDQGRDLSAWMQAHARELQPRSTQ